MPYLINLKAEFTQYKISELKNSIANTAISYIVGYP